MTYNFSNLQKVINIHVEIRYEEIEAINKFVLYNSEATQPWVELYKQKRMKWDSDKK